MSEVVTEELDGLQRQVLHFYLNTQEITCLENLSIEFPLNLIYSIIGKFQEQTQRNKSQITNLEMIVQKLLHENAKLKADAMEGVPYRELS
jgi:hypothetical protein